ncbi:MAG: SGNH/GDSL hydrolase family protein [Clostridia bacterium]|nr:SGNH/GDSL hydrolase family protein [Clostridia bacterium]
MKFDFEKLKECTNGIEYLEKTENGFIPHRFSLDEERAYKEYRSDYYTKCLSPASVRIEFKTDAEALFISYNVKESSSRLYFATQVFVNGEYKGGNRNFNSTEEIQGNPSAKFELGTFGARVDLGEGEKDVSIVLPFSVILEITELRLDGATYANPIKKSKTLLAYGDSITHGYDAFYPANSYINRLGSMLDVTVCNKAIGGEIFFPELLGAENGADPDYVTVAYGTNDHSRGKREKTERDARLFYKTLREKYPRAKIFAITPIWRWDVDTVKPFGDFHDVEKIIAAAIKDLDDVYLIRGFDFVPHAPEYFADLSLHPNDTGFEHYAKNLYEQIVKYL